MMGGWGYGYGPYGPSRGFASTPTAAGTPAPVAAGDVVRGKQVFLRNCAACHGADAGGSQLGPSLISTEAAANDDDSFRDVIANGRPGTSMPPYGGVLSPQDIEDVIAFLRSKQ
jgi:mono/diheme cytochrome c family protein